MKHPDPIIQKNQNSFLKKLPENEREYHAQIFRIGNATLHYHNLARSFEPTVEIYTEWLNGLPANIRKGMEKLGFEKCKTVLSFTRYVNERNDIGLDQFMKENLTIQDYEAHIKALQNLK